MPVKVLRLTATEHLVSLLLKEHVSKVWRMTMDLKLSNLEAVAVMNALQRYVKELEKSGEEKGVQIEKKTVKGLIDRMEDMPPGEVS
jgi:DNA polymerase III delta subunit